MKKLIYYSLFAVTILVLSACSEENKKVEEEGASEQVEETKEKDTQKNDTAVVVDKSDTVKKDEELEKQFEKMNGVSQVNLLITEDGGGTVLLDFETKLDKNKAKQLAGDFAIKLKDKYANYMVDVQARSGGEKIAQVTLKKG